jgi:hypothetical protein
MKTTAAAEVSAIPGIELQSESIAACQQRLFEAHACASIKRTRVSTPSIQRIADDERSMLRDSTCLMRALELSIYMT